MSINILKADAIIKRGIKDKQKERGLVSALPAFFTQILMRLP